MAKYIDKAALVAEIDRQKIGYNVDGKHFVEYDVIRKIIDIINTLEVKEEPVSKEFWLFTIRFDNEILNCFFDWFPSKRDLKKASNGKKYAVIHTMQLTEEQFNKLTKDE